MAHRGLVAAVIAGLLSGALLLVTPSAAAVADEPEALLCAALDDPISNLQNSVTSTTLLTASPSEAAKAMVRRDFEESGDDFAASTTPLRGLADLTRAYSGKRNDFYWTSDDKAPGYTLQKVDFFAAPAPLTCTVPVYEFIRYRHHMYVWSAERADQLRQDGWERGSIAFHAIPIGSGEPLDVSSATTDSGEDQRLCAALTHPVHHVRRSLDNGTDLLTLWANEADKADSDHGFDQTLEPLRAATTSTDGLTALYRYYSSHRKDFQWSAAAVDEAYTLQKSDFFVSDKALSCTVAVMEFTKDERHRYAWSEDETVALFNDGWTLARVAFHAVPGSDAQPAENPGETAERSTEAAAGEAAQPADFLHPLMPRHTALMMLR